MRMNKMRADVLALLFLLPFLAVYGLFTIWPMVKGVQMTFYKWTLIKKMKYVGWDNYSKMFHDQEVWAAIWHSAIFVILTTPTMIVLAIVLAMIANRKSRLQKLYRSVFFLPSVLSVAVASYLGLFVFQPYNGFVNTLLHLIRLLPENREIFWLTELSLSWIALTLITLWWTVGFNFILYLSAMQDIPDEIVEAAKLDGASDSVIFWKITLPYLTPITKTIAMLQIISSFKVFFANLYHHGRRSAGQDETDHPAYLPDRLPQKRSGLRGYHVLHAVRHPARAVRHPVLHQQPERSECLMWKWIYRIVSVIFGFLFIAPIVWMLVVSIKKGRHENRHAHRLVHAAVFVRRVRRYPERHQAVQLDVQQLLRRDLRHRIHGRVRGDGRVRHVEAALPL
ncbi:sugar ABC transporter permease [Cohnella ginsengisoli]|uniref:Sugar ABC transporter permease n=1 Tax=Cohnella ginsengisoli TaxID=425004 RepID=A0A9X4KNH3_9BACL|nr:sugar ABC transporter permease [Cohnella ginsengisoli]MDG0792870.1 sugar ABC transporter permease [Cohnella ginsengisoli]